MGRDGVRLVFKTPASMKGRRDMVASITRKGRGGGGGSEVELERGGSTNEG